jgi:hypothetical protein
MTSEDYKDILYNHRILWWSARILGTLEAGFLIYLAYDQLIKGLINQGTSAFITLIGGQYFLAVTLTIAFIGLIIAYWKEGLGGGISLASFIVLFIGWNDFHVNFIVGMAIAALPGFLYFTFWLKVYLDIKKTEQDQRKDR